MQCISQISSGLSHSSRSGWGVDFSPPFFTPNTFLNICFGIACFLFLEWGRKGSLMIAGDWMLRAVSRLELKCAHARVHTSLYLSLSHTHTHTRTHTQTHTHTHTRAHIHTHTYTHAPTHPHTHTHTHARTHALTHARTHTRTHHIHGSRSIEHCACTHAFCVSHYTQ